MVQLVSEVVTNLNMRSIIEFTNASGILHFHLNKMEDTEFLKALLAKMNTNMKTNQEHMKEMMAKMDDNQAKADAYRKTYQDMLAKMEANGEAIQERMVAKMNTTLEEMNASHKEMLAKVEKLCTQTKLRQT
jgi:hypothetical protein